MDALELLPAGPVRARLRAPASKSVTNRALLCAALADGTSLLRDPLDSDDSQAMRAALTALGAGIQAGPVDGIPVWRVCGTAGRLAVPAAPLELDARTSGTTMRFLTAVATLVPPGAGAGPAVTVTGRPGLLARPIGPLVAALRALGAAITDQNGYPPVTAVGGGLDGGQVTLNAAASSQFASAVLLAAPYARRPVELRVTSLGAPAYVALTAQVMRDFGAAVIHGEGVWRVEARPYQAREVAVEYDASAAAHLFAVAAATGGEVTVTNAPAGSWQPDAQLPALLEAMGCTVRRDGAALTVCGPERLDPVDADLAAMPDQVTTVAVLAALAHGRSRLRGVAVARGHETDRLAALATELGKLGAEVTELPDGLVIDSREPRGPARIDPHDDHRLAMAFAALAARVPGVTIEQPGCVAKTYPGFWDDLARAGVHFRRERGPA